MFDSINPAYLPDLEFSKTLHRLHVLPNIFGLGDARSLARRFTDPVSQWWKDALLLSVCFSTKIASWTEYLIELDLFGISNRCFLTFI